MGRRDRLWHIAIHKDGGDQMESKAPFERFLTMDILESRGGFLPV